jgi:hypothetical protein
MSADRLAVSSPKAFPPAKLFGILHLHANHPPEVAVAAGSTAGEKSFTSPSKSSVIVSHMICVPPKRAAAPKQSA